MKTERPALAENKRKQATSGYGSKLNHQTTAAFFAKSQSPCFHVPDQPMLGSLDSWPIHLRCLSPLAFAGSSQSHMISMRCRTFNATAGGYMRGDGCSGLTLGEAFWLGGGGRSLTPCFLGVGSSVTLFFLFGGGGGRGGAILRQTQAENEQRLSTPHFSSSMHLFIGCPCLPCPTLLGYGLQ